MKHTLKSLLITAVLTLPITFAADLPIGDTPDSKPVSFNSLPIEVSSLISGVVDSKKILSSGFLTLPEVAALAQTSTKWHAALQPIINTANTWRNSAVAKRLLDFGPKTQEDINILRFFGISQDNLFNTLLDLFFDKRIIQNDTDHMTGLIADNTNLTNYEKSLITRIIGIQHNKRIIPRTDIVDVADKLRALGPGYYDKAAILYERAAQNCNSSLFILTVVDNLSRLGLKYYDKVAAILEQFANHPNAISYDIRAAAVGLRGLGPNYYVRIAELLEKSANHPKASSYDIQAAADELGNLGPDYYLRASELYEHYVNHSNATLADIRWAASGLSKLGQVYYNRVAELYEQSASPEKNPTSLDIRAAADRLVMLGYHDRAAALLTKLNQQ